MSAEIDDPISTKVYTTRDGRAVIEQSNGAVVLISAEQIITIIHELHKCYDYCAAWKEPPQS